MVSPTLPLERPAQIAGPSPERSSGRIAGLLACYGIAVLVLATIFGALDRQIMLVLAEPMRQSLGLSDARLGLLTGAGITLFAGLAAVPLGWLADRFGRRGVLALCVLVWSAATAACGLAADFAALFIAAAFLGLGEAGLTPIIYGLIPDVVPERRRVLANGLYALAAIFGAGLGISLSGALVQSLEGLRGQLPMALQTLEPWRLAFLAVALPGPLTALMILLIRLHPQRGGAAEAMSTQRLLLTGYVRAHRATLIGVFGGTGLATLGVAASSNWVPIIAARSFGASAAEVGRGVGAAYLLGTAAGALLGAAGVKLLHKRHGAATPIRVLGIGSALAAVGAAAMAAVSSALLLYVLFGVQVAALIAGSVLAPTFLQDMTPPALRSRVIALGSVITLGLSAASPVLVGALSDALHGTPQGLLASTAGIAATAFALGAVAMRSAEPFFVRTVHTFNPDRAVAKV